MRRLRFAVSSVFLFLFLAGVAWGAAGLGATPYGLVTLKDGRVVYTTSENYTSGTVGIIDPSTGDVTSDLRTNLGGDTVAFVFDKAGSEKVLIANRLSYGALTEIQVFDPSDWNTPEWNETVNGNLHGIASTSDGLYLAYYGSGSGLGWIERRSISSSYPVVISKDMVPVVSEDKAESILSTDGDRVFLLAQGYSSYSASPANGALYRLGADLGVLASVDVGLNPVKLTARGENLYVVSNGGYDPSKDQVWLVDGASMVAEELTFEGFFDKNEFVQAVFDNGSRLFVATSAPNSSDPTAPYVNRVYCAERPSSIKGALASVALGDPVASLDGWTMGSSLGGDGRLWVCSSSGSDGSVKGISSSGSVETYTPTGNDHPTGGGGGGCSVGFAPAVILLFAPILLLSRGR
ncbi:MAG: hypothetical protein U9Q00_07705 [Synergistota bacterium]|nr:hypothetical protein [Synergistota bacterium]